MMPVVQRYRRKLQEEGYEGVKYLNTVEGPYLPANQRGSYIVFEPNKYGETLFPAYGADPDILKQVGFGQDAERVMGIAGLRSDDIKDVSTFNEFIGEATDAMKRGQEDLVNSYLMAALRTLSDDSTMTLSSMYDAVLKHSVTRY